MSEDLQLRIIWALLAIIFAVLAWIVSRLSPSSD